MSILALILDDVNIFLQRNPTVAPRYALFTVLNGKPDYRAHYAKLTRDAQRALVQSIETQVRSAK